MILLPSLVGSTSRDHIEKGATLAAHITQTANLPYCLYGLIAPQNNRNDRPSPLPFPKTRVVEQP